MMKVLSKYNQKTLPYFATINRVQFLIYPKFSSLATKTEKKEFIIKFQHLLIIFVYLLIQFSLCDADTLLFENNKSN